MCLSIQIHILRPCYWMGLKLPSPLPHVPMWEMLEFRTHDTNMAPWHIEYPKMKEFETWQGQEELSDFPLKQVICLI